MADQTLYYALTISAEGTSTPAYYALTPTSNLEFSQGGVTFAPTAESLTMANFYPETLQLQAPAGSFNAAVTIVTGDSAITGRAMVSPPVDVAVVVTLYGAGGQQLGQMIIDPATDGKTFNFPVGSAQAIPRGELAGVLRGLVPAATP